MSVTTRDLITPIVFGTYGNNPMAEGLADDLAAKIDADAWRDRERMVMLKCWDWFPGGDTAMSVAAKIESVLPERVS